MAEGIVGTTAPSADAHLPAEASVAGGARVLAVPVLTDAPRPLVRRFVSLMAAVALVQSSAWPLAMLVTGWEGVSVRPLAVAAAGLQMASTALMIGIGWWRRSYPERVVLANAVVSGVALVMGGAATAAGYGASFAHPTVPLAVWAGMLVAICLGRRATAMALGGLTLAYAVGAAATLIVGTRALSGLGGEVVSLVGVPLVARLLARPWLAAGTATVRMEADLAVARDQVRAAEAREVERAKQYRTLHDTVLSTLSALSRGTLDPQQHDIRQRISADADYLRGLIATTDSAAGMYLVGEVARLTREQAAAGLRVHPHVADVPDDVPGDVVRAMSDCVREALNNVVKHAGTAEAWVTVVGHTEANPIDVRPDGRTRLLVTVTDRGHGFDPGKATRGLGLKGSIRARMIEAGGTALVDSEPGQGTTVELRWPA
jgi:signal transduction histidine kinase